MFKIEKFEIDWERILKKDPLECAQSLICQIVSGTESQDEDAIIMKYLIEYVVQNRSRVIQLKPMLVSDTQ